MSQFDDHLAWDRGWVPPDAGLPLVHDAWLLEPEVLDLFSSDIVTLKAVRSLPCLLLLGEAGSGKSFALRREVEEARRSAPTCEVVIYKDLGLPSDALDLRLTVFEDPALRAWRAGTGRLHLFLDALDEAKIQIRRVVSILQQQLDALEFDRLSLRIACRTADRPVELESWLERKFGEAGFKTLELAPLRISETKSGATAAGIDAERFVALAIAGGVAPLAARPLTLKMLLRVYAAAGGFPHALTSLYRQALLLMASEDDEERKGLRTLTDTQSFAVAARIAAATILSGRDVIAGDGDGAVSTTALAGGSEPDRLVAQPTDVDVRETAIREVLATGLFTARPGGVGWAHRTFGEYLAAYWLAGDRLSDAQIADLVLVDDGTSCRVNPALRTVVGWLLALRPDFRRHVMPVDSVVLAYGDPASVDAQVRRDLLTSLLDAIDDRQLEPRDLRSLWRRLAYDGMADDLLARITETTSDVFARDAAIDAGVDLGIRELLPALIGLAIDATEPVTLRTSALYALKNLGLADGLERIRPLALRPQLEDDDDELKGAALMLCWPSAITASELFDALTPEKNEALTGAYATFLRTECVQHLRTAEDLALGIRWGMTLPRPWDATSDLNLAADAIVARAWPLAATDATIAAALADLVALIVEPLKPVFSSPSMLRESEAPDIVLRDGAANIAILDVLVSRAAAGRFPHDHVMRAVWRILADGIEIRDVIERWSATDDDAERAAWLIAIRALARGANADALFDLKGTHDELYAIVAERYEPILLDSREAEALRSRWQVEEAELKIPSQDRVDPGELDRDVGVRLDAFRNGDVDAFWRLQWPLMADDDGRIRGHAQRDDLTESARWRRLPERVREDLVDAAFDYLRLADSKPSEWLGKDVVYWPTHAGYCALKLVFKERPAAFETLDADVWRRWAPAIVAWRRYNESEDDDDFRQVAYARVRSFAPDVARDTVIGSFANRLSAGDIAAARARLAELWDDSLDEALFTQLARADLDLHQVTAILDALLAVDHPGALAWASARLTVDNLLGDEDVRALALEIAGVLARHAPGTLWERLESIAVADDAAARVVLARLAGGSESGWDAELDPHQSASLYGLLQRLLPRDPDSGSIRSFTVTIEDHASFWRGRIVERLVMAGTPQAVAAITELEQEFDEYGWLRRMRHRAQEQLRRVSWRPPDPADVVRMGGADRRRYVPDAAALRRIVLDALDEIARDMRGAYPLAPAIWNTKPHRLPKDENEISNELAKWLRGKLAGRVAVVNREIEVNARTSKGGDRPDVVVQAKSSTADTLTVAIEVKGAWHEQLMTSMSGQLAAKYLKPDLTEQGIYVVFWFGADGWDDYGNPTEQARRRRATRAGVAELSAILTRQAVEVSRDQGVTIAAIVIDGTLG